MIKQFERWLNKATEDVCLLQELTYLLNSGDSEGICDRFYRELEFGTGGLRGVIGAGTNRMNIYTVRKATQGLADYLKASGLPQSVAIAYDSRRKGELFARETARVLAANGITAWLYPRLEPTPALSWAVRYLGCGAGVCVTASHNPAKYNGYKVYGADGCQITLDAARQILARINAVDCFDDVRTAAERANGCIDGFIGIPVDELREHIGELDPKKPIYVHCQSGLRSYIACRMLTGCGIECYNLSGGYSFYSSVTKDQCPAPQGTGPCGLVRNEKGGK